MENEPVSPKTRTVNQKNRKAIVLVLAFIAAGAAIAYYLRVRSFESTDNAFIEGSVVQVSPRVPGQVINVYVTDNQRVRKGDLLVEIDARDYELKVAETKARLLDAQARLSSAQSGVDLTSDVTNATLVQAAAALEAARNQIDVLTARLQQEDADVKAAEAALRQSDSGRTAAEAAAKRAEADAMRYRILYKKDEVSRQTLDRAEADEKASKANLEAASHAIAGARARLEQATSARAATASSLQQATNLAKQAAGSARRIQAGAYPRIRRPIRPRANGAARVHEPVGRAESLVHKGLCARRWNRHAEIRGAGKFCSGRTDIDGDCYRPALGSRQFQGNAA
jgi:membrane fusion protein (multidrug efflux system)